MYEAKNGIEKNVCFDAFTDYRMDSVYIYPFIFCLDGKQLMSQ